MKTKRKTETEEEFNERLKRTAEKAADVDLSLDEMVRRSIKLHGP